jgi:hypothetical protein
MLLISKAHLLAALYQKLWNIVFLIVIIRFLLPVKQFGFKKGYGCSRAVYTPHFAIDHDNSRGTTVNLCSIDLTKAFDKMNHHDLLQS